jgi:RNA polymerase sigma-70 factor (ECF subfamily)
MEGNFLVLSLAGTASAWDTHSREGIRLGLLQDEAMWVERARQGDEAAFAAIYQRYERPIYALICRLLGNEEDAFDLTQDVFIKAYKALNNTSPDLNLSAWLHRIASNACLDVFRRRKIVRWLPWDPTEHANITPAKEVDEPERHIIQRETTAQVQSVLNRMAENYRLCLVLKEYQDLSCEEIAEVMNISKAAVKSQLFRAREQFREIYLQFEAQGWQTEADIKRRKRGRKGKGE